MKSFILFVLLIPLVTFSYAKDIDHVTVKVKRGDVLNRILSKYSLDQDACNVEAFYALNNMKKGQQILAGFQYKLPISVYTYNDKSIRSTIGIDDWNVAVAIQDYNKELKKTGIKKTYFLEDKKLYVPYHLIGCGSKASVENKVDSVTETETSEATPKKDEKEYVVSNIFFGKGMLIEKVSNDLANQVYYIISGHGGPDPGAMKKVGSEHLCEDEYAYDVSLRLAKKLLENGAIVHMIIHDKNDGIRDKSYLGIDNDEVCETKGVIPLNQLARLRQRVDAVNGLYKKEKKTTKVQKVIAIHVDSRSTSLKQDVFFYHAPGSRSGKELAQELQNTFRTKYSVHQKGRGYNGSVSARNLYVLKNTNPTAVYVELANIQNASNQKRIMPYTNRQVLAEWLYEGLIK